MSVQASLDAPHHYAPPAVAAGERLDLGEDMLASADDLTAGQQHEAETSVDHAMISPGALAALPPLGAQTYVGAHGLGRPVGHPAATLERPPRAALAA